jgi:hypothetical protein
MITYTHLDMLVYFWEEKGDVTRYCEWERMQPELQRKYPEIIKAWNDYLASRRTLTAVLHYALDHLPSAESEGRS